MTQSADLAFWEQLDNYEEHIISVFKVSNPLTQLLEEYPDKGEKTIIDFGCGTGNAIPHIDGFKKVYAVDFSENMLNKAREAHGAKTHVEFIRGDLMGTKVEQPADVILAVSSVMPQSTGDFYQVLENFRSNLKPDGEIIMVLPSFEAHTFLYQLKADHMAAQGGSIEDMRDMLIKAQMDANYNPLGYIRTDIGLIQKHWLEAEIRYRLEPFDFASVRVEKLEMDWTDQVRNLKDYAGFPKLWFWSVRITV